MPKVNSRATDSSEEASVTNQGAAGIDGESLAMFEADLSRNLYKLWNRMSSGSYFPLPVKQVQIPKKQGGVRNLRGAHSC